MKNVDICQQIFYNNHSATYTPCILVAINIKFWSRIAGLCIWVFTFLNIQFLKLCMFCNGVSKIIFMYKLLHLTKDKIIAAIKIITIHLWFMLGGIISWLWLCNPWRFPASHGRSTNSKSWLKKLEDIIWKWKKNID